MTPRANQPAQLRRRADRAEALLEAERRDHEKTFAAWRDAAWELVIVKGKLQRVLAILNGKDE